MKRVIATLIAGTALAAAAPAFAADLPEPIPTAPIAAPVQEATVFDWTGFYLGANAGYVWGDRGGAVDAASDGFTGGLFAGYNYAVNPNWVVGIEGDINIADGEDFAVGGTSFSSDSLYYGSLRARVGYTFDAFMIYGTGGLAMAYNDFESGGSSDSNTHFGYAVGAGLEAALTENVTARAEYLYMDTSSESYTAGGTTFDTDFDGHVVRAGIGYKF